MDDETERLRELVEEGRSVREIADALGVARVTVRRRLERAGLRTLASAEARAAREARRDGAPVALRECRLHGLTEHRTDERGCLRCRRCRAEAVIRRRAKVRDLLLAEAGGACVLCGYARHPGALQFHHVDPGLKSFTIRNGDTRALAELRAEIRKCVLLCANCHAEVEAGVVRLPVCPTMHGPDATVSGHRDPG